MAQTIGFEVAEGIATLTLNRPDRLNALTTQMTSDLLDALKTCAREDAIRCVVLTGEGRGFCAGQDLAELQTVSGSWSVGDHLRHGFNRVVLAIRELEKPVLGVINGVAAGAGLGLALATDMRLASDKARFAAAFIGIGLAPDTGVSWLVQQALGPARAFEFLTTGRTMSPEEAMQVGLVNRVVAHDELGAVTMMLASQLATGPTRGIGLTKRVLNRIANQSLAEALEYEAQIQDIAIRTTDHHEGVMAFVQKRPPQFKGK